MKQAKSEADKAKSERTGGKCTSEYRQLYAQISIAREQLSRKLAQRSTRGLPKSKQTRIIRLPKDELFKTGEMKLSKRGLANIRIRPPCSRRGYPAMLIRKIGTRQFQERCDDIKYKLEAVFLRPC